MQDGKRAESKKKRPEIKEGGEEFEKECRDE
jgi:hypothetical protein